MKGTNKIIRVSMIIALIFFSLSIISLHAKSEKSAENKEAVENAENETVITIKITPKAVDKKSQVDSEPFSLKKSENNNKHNLNLSQKNDFSQKNSTVNYEPYKHLKRNFRAQKIEQGFFTSTIVTLAALNIADYFSTKEALKYEGLTEGNPLMKPFVKNSLAFAAVKIGMTALSTTMLHKLHKKDKTVAWVVSIVSNFALSYVVATNIKLINKVKNG